MLGLRVGAGARVIGKVTLRLSGPSPTVTTRDLLTMYLLCTYYVLTVTTRDFSRRYWFMRAPTMLPLGSMRILTNLPKRDELLLRAVLALPKASSTGLDCRRVVARSVSCCTPHAVLHPLCRATPLMPCYTPYAVLHPLTCRMASARVSMPPPLLERHAR